MSENQNSGLDLVFNAGTAMSLIRDVDGTPFLVVPEGFNIQSLESMMKAPGRNKGKVELRDETGFIDYVNLHKGDETDLFYSPNPPAFTAIFNSKRKGKPGWSDFRAQYACPLSHEWKEWTANDGRRMSQVDFAQFIEENLPYIVEPENAQMLEIALTLEAKKKVNFVSGVRLSNGSNEFTYEEQVDGSAAKGKIKIPEIIALGIRVFENGAPYRVEARFRYRIGDGGQLAMWYELIRPHLVLEDAVAEALGRIEEKTELRAFNGNA